MRSYSFDDSIEARPDGIQYAEMEYRSFVVREVMRNGKSIGEYHIKTKDASSNAGAVQYFKSHLNDCEVGLVDPDGILNLEYPIYVTTKSNMVIDNIIEIFCDIDNKINE